MGECTKDQNKTDVRFFIQCIDDNTEDKENNKQSENKDASRSIVIFPGFVPQNHLMILQV